MNLKNKKLIWIIAIALIAIIIIALIINKINKSNSSNKNGSASNLVETLDIWEVFDIEDVESSKIAISKSKNEKVASKYAVGRNVYVTDNKIRFNDRDGKVIFLRDGYNDANIYQTTYRVDEDGSLSSQIGERMQKFIDACTSYMGASEDNSTYTEMLYGGSTTSGEMPIEESIYLENRLYSLTYRINQNMDSNLATEDTSQKYDINFYMSDGYLVCEFVRIL